MANDKTSTATETAEDKKERQQYGITANQFVDAWQSSNTAQEVADKLSKLAGKTVPKAIVLARKATYVKKGVSLKRMARVNPRKMNVDALNARIKGEDEGAGDGTGAEA